MCIPLRVIFFLLPKDIFMQHMKRRININLQASELQINNLVVQNIIVSIYRSKWKNTLYNLSLIYSKIWICKKSTWWVYCRGKLHAIILLASPSSAFSLGIIVNFISVHSCRNHFWNSNWQLSSAFMIASVK